MTTEFVGAPDGCMLLHECLFRDQADEHTTSFVLPLLFSFPPNLYEGPMFKSLKTMRNNKYFLL